MPTERGEMQAAVLDDRIYVPGGLTGWGESTVQHAAYDPEADAWEALAPLPEPRNHHAVAAVDGRVFVLGGNDDVLFDPPSRDVVAYDPDGDRWTDRAPLPDGRWGHEAVVVDGTLFVVGGHVDEDDEPADTLAYDSAADAWERRAAVPTQRDHLSVEARGGDVYAAGGRQESPTEPHYSGENVVDHEVFHPDEGAWETLAPLPEPASGMAAGVLGTRLHLTGGEDPSAVGGEVKDVHQVYDPNADAWSTAEPLPVPLHGQASVVHGGRLYVIGGAERQGTFSPQSWSDRVFVYPAGGR